jgi:hypothetical protein
MYTPDVSGAVVLAASGVHDANDGEEGKDACVATHEGIMGGT